MQSNVYGMYNAYGLMPSGVYTVKNFSKGMKISDDMYRAANMTHELFQINKYNYPFVHHHLLNDGRGPQKAYSMVDLSYVSPNGECDIIKHMDDISPVRHTEMCGDKIHLFVLKQTFLNAYYQIDVNEIVKIETIEVLNWVSDIDDLGCVLFYLNRNPVSGCKYDLPIYSIPVEMSLNDMKLVAENFSEYRVMKEYLLNILL